jgi:hypothetical protein
MRLIVAILLALLLLDSASAAETPGTICIAPIPPGTPATSAAPGLMCSSGNLSLRIDSRPTTPWPREGNQRIEPLDGQTTHRVVVLCDGKPQQSFRFNFTQFKSRKLCLFLNDLYQTAQLWEDSKSPWCKCAAVTGNR